MFWKMPEIWTVGYGGLGKDLFLASLRRAGIEAVADVRSAPFSRAFPWVCKEQLKQLLKDSGIAYVWLPELGGKVEVSSYEEVWESEAFLKGIGRLEAGAGKMRVAMLCAEMDPMECHRGLMVGEFLFRRGWRVVHLWPEREEEHGQACLRLANRLGMKDSLFWSGEDLRREAVREMGKRVLGR